MPTESRDPAASAPPALDSGVKEALEKIAELAREKFPPSGAGALALVRVLSGIGLEEWRRFAAANDCEHWFGIPLDCVPKEAVSHALSLHHGCSCLTERDPLTGIGNQKLFHRVFSAECERALRSRADLSLLMLEVNDFTPLRDTCGHEGGLHALQSVGALLKAHIRRYDVAARLDGGTFAVILPATSGWTAVILGNRLLECIQRQTVRHNGATFSMSCFGGAAGLVQESGENCADELLHSAHEALKRAKQQGATYITLIDSPKIVRERSSLVFSEEKQFLFSCLGSLE
jgi:diguanylate cyclase (GGDEF)-like protein